MMLNKNIARLLFVASVVALPSGRMAAEELFRYRDTMLQGVPSAELSLPLEECRNVCLARSGCAGFVHKGAAKTCQMFASVEGAADMAGNTAETRSPVLGYRQPLNPPDASYLCAEKAGPKIGSRGVLLESLDATAAISVCRKAASARNAKPETFAYYARSLEKAGRAAESLKWAKKSVHTGNAVGQWLLGSLYEHGTFVDQEDVQAAHLYVKSADQGYLVGQYNLGLFYEKGRGGLRKDVEKAVNLYRLAADQGYDPALLRLGLLYELGRGVTADKAEALRFYRLAMQAGDAAARGRIEAMCGPAEELVGCEPFRKKSMITDMRENQ